MEYSNNAYQPPDLASVLRTLSALAPAQAQAPAHQQPFSYQSEAPPNDDELEEGEYDPADDYSPSEPIPPASQPPHRPHPPPSTNPKPNSQTSQTHAAQPQPAPAPKSVDPSTITTYPRALHHILHLTTTSPNFLPSIRTLLTTQYRHEREWHAQRLALQSRLANRAESRSKLDNVLSALGGKVSTAGKVGQGGKDEGEDGEGREEEEKRRELERFDRKVWKAQTEMVRSMGRDLGNLGVPGFVGEVWKEGEEEGRVLRGRVVGLLEDLCKGEGEGGG